MRTVRAISVHALLLAAVLLPPALALDAVARYGLRFPFWDQWEFAAALPSLYAGRYGFADLFSQHNEHRPVFPRLAFVGLALASRWDVRWELYANVALAGLTLLVLWRLIRLTTRDAAPGLGRWLVVAASWLTFSMAQFENWSWGWQLHVFLTVLATVIAVWALTEWPGEWRGLGVAGVAGVVAAFSFANGLLVLGLLPLAVLATPAVPRRRRAGLLATSVALAAGTTVAYFATYQKPPHHPALFGTDWLSYLSYVAIYCGAPLGAGEPDVSRVAGILGMPAFGVAAAWLRRRRPEAARLLLPWSLLALYAVGSAAVTGMARAGFGAREVANRYTSIALLFWLSLLVVGGLVVRLPAWHLGWRTPAQRAVTAATALALVATGVGFGLTYRWGRDQLKARAAVLRDAEECILAYRRAPDACLERIYPSPPLLRGYAIWLEAHGFGPFAPHRRPAPLSRYVLEQPPDGREPGAIATVRAERGAAPPVSRRDRVVVDGWTAHADGRRVRAALVVVDGEVLGSAAVRDGGEPSRSAWRYRFGGFRLSPGAHVLEAYAVLPDGRRIVRLAGSRTIEVTE